MLSRFYRFHGHGSLNHVYRRGHTVRGSLFAVRYGPNDRRRHFRAAVVVSKKVSKSAVTRNRIRRRLYELLRLHAAEITQPYDIVITVFDGRVATMPAAELSRMLGAQLAQAGITAAPAVDQ